MISRQLFRVSLAVLTWLGLAAANSFAQGLHVALTTSGYSFPSAAPAATASVAKGKAKVKVRGEVISTADGTPSFTASAAISNMSFNQVPFSFPNPMAAARHWTFTVLDSTGAQVWISDTDEGATPMATPEVLMPQRAWRRTVQVPLVVGGTPLAVGLYTLQASIAGAPMLGATAVFEVSDGSIPGNTGIKGQVFQGHILAGVEQPLATGNAGSNVVVGPILPPVVGVQATVTVTQVLDPSAGGTPFTWTGETDSSGNYSVATPPGKYQVTAVADPTTTTGTSGAASANLQSSGNATTSMVVVDPLPPVLALVVVDEGKFTVHNIYLPSIVVNPPPPPPTDTGVTGTVTQMSADPSGSPTPLAGATVQVSPQFTVGPIGPIGPIQPLVTLPTATVTGTTIFFPFETQTGTTDDNGNFTIDQFPGNYRVTVFVDAVPGVYDPTTSMPVAFASVTITSEQFTTVNLQAPAPISSSAVPVSSITTLKILATGTSTVGGTPQNILLATGTVPSTGWTQPALRPRPSSNPLELDFDFVAVPPDGEPVAKVVTDISASIPWPSTQVSVIKVYSASNSKQLNFALPLAAQAH